MIRRRSRSREWTRYSTHGHNQVYLESLPPLTFTYLLLTVFVQGHSELVAKDDNLDAADANKDKKKQDREEPGEEEEREQIHEQGDEVGQALEHLPLPSHCTLEFHLYICMPCVLLRGSSMRTRWTRIMDSRTNNRSLKPWICRRI